MKDTHEKSVQRFVWGIAGGLFLLLLPIGLLIAPIWDSPPVVDGHVVVPERVQLPPEQNSFADILALAQRIGHQISERPQQWMEWQNKPEEHRESIESWLLENRRFPEDLRAVMHSKSFQVPWVPDLNGDRPWVSDLLNLYSHLNRLTTFQNEVAEGLKLLQLQVDLWEHFSALPPDSLIDALIHIAGASMAASRGLDLIHRFSNEMRKEDLLTLKACFIRLEAFDASILIQTLEQEYIMFRDAMEKLQYNLGPAIHGDIPAWMPTWNSYFYQPVRTRQYMLDILELNRAKLMGQTPPPPWSSADEMDKWLTEPGRFGIRQYHNYLGKMILYPYDMSSQLNRMTVTARAGRLLAALHLHRLAFGELPESLGQLVTAYLDTVPLDPYDGLTLRYDRDRAIIWSVNEDGIDQGGSRKGSAIPHRQEDLIFTIDGDAGNP